MTPDRISETVLIVSLIVVTLLSLWEAIDDQAVKYRAYQMRLDDAESMTFKCVTCGKAISWCRCIERCAECRQRVCAHNDESSSGDARRATSQSQ